MQTNDSGHVAGGKTEADTSVHTALPWHVTDSIHNGKVYISKEGSERGSVALCEREEDAAFIVRACNAHADLVTALQAFVDTAGIMDRETGETREQEDSQLFADARAALAKAGA